MVYSMYTCTWALWLPGKLHSNTLLANIRCVTVNAVPYIKVVPNTGVVVILNSPGKLPWQFPKCNFLSEMSYLEPHHVYMYVTARFTCIVIDAIKWSRGKRAFRRGAKPVPLAHRNASKLYRERETWLSTILCELKTKKETRFSVCIKFSFEFDTCT